MATNYAGAVRNGSQEAARLHQQLGTRDALYEVGGNVDVFKASLDLKLPLILRPLKGLLGAYFPDPVPGILVTTQRPLSIQRFTTAHELGHFRLSHLPSLDDDNMLRRMALPNASPALSGPNMQEVEADAFATAFMMPRWLIDWHCKRQGWNARSFTHPFFVYQLSLRLGSSYEATTWTLHRQNIITASTVSLLRQTAPRTIKSALLRDYKPSDFNGDVWHLTERDGGTQIDGSRNDHFVLDLKEHSGGGYVWDIDQLRESGFAVLRDDRDETASEGIGNNTARSVIGTPDKPRRGLLSLTEARPWTPNEPISTIKFDYDFTGPEEEGLSRAERRKILEVAA